MLTLVSRHLWDRLAFWGPITLLINVYVCFSFPFWPPGLVFLGQGSLSEAGAGGRCAGGQGLKVALGFPEALLLTVIAAHRVGGRWQCCRGKQDGKQPLASAPRVCIAPLAPRKQSQEEGTSPRPHDWPCASQTSQVCVPSMQCPLPLACVCSLCGCARGSVCMVGTQQGNWGLLFAGRAGAASSLALP